MAFDPLNAQEEILLKGLSRVNGWTPKDAILKRYKRDTGVVGGRTAGVLHLVTSLLPGLVDKAYAKKEQRGDIEGYSITPRGQAVLAQ